MVTQAELQQLGSAQAVFEYARNNGISLEQLAQIGGTSTAEMANLAASQGIDPKQLSQIGYTGPVAGYPAPAPATPQYQPVPAGTPAISGQTGYMDVTTGQFKYFGTPEYDAWQQKLAPELNAIGITMPEYLGGGVGARLMSNPLTDAYSSAFAENNSGGGGQAWAQSQGGRIGFGQKNGFVDAKGYSTGQGDWTGRSKIFDQYANRMGAAPGVAGLQASYSNFVNPQTPVASTTPTTPLVAQPNSNGATTTGMRRRSLGNWNGFVNPQNANTQTTQEI